MHTSTYICGPTWDQRVVNITSSSSIGILMSGGIDSWVLYNMLLKDIPSNNIKLLNIKRPDGIDNSFRIKMLTSRSDIVEVEVDQSIKLTIDKVIDTYPDMQIFTGVNIIPHTEYFPEFGDEERPRRPWRIDWPSVSVPFHHLYKYHIIDLAIKNNVDLSNTMSCTRSADSHCGQCWQCRERAWGFKQLEV